MNLHLRKERRTAKILSSAVCELGDGCQLLETPEHAFQADSDSRAKIVVYGKIVVVAMMNIDVAVTRGGTGTSLVR